MEPTSRQLKAGVGQQREHGRQGVRQGHGHDQGLYLRVVVRGPGVRNIEGGDYRN
jgi:hypothetical protein